MVLAPCLADPGERISGQLRTLYDMGVVAPFCRGMFHSVHIAEQQQMEPRAVEAQLGKGCEQRGKFGELSVERSPVRACLRDLIDLAGIQPEAREGDQDAAGDLLEPALRDRGMETMEERP